MRAPILYTRSGEVNIAYQVTGDGLFDLVLVPGFFSHLEIYWEHPELARFLERLGSFARLIWFDKRGTGLSDRSVGLPDFETRMDDVRAVMDAVGSEQAALFGYSRAGRCASCSRRRIRNGRALVLHGTYAKRIRSDDYPWAPTWEERLATARELEETWGENVDMSTMFPNADPAETAWFHRAGRASLSPAGARDLILMNSMADVRDVLPSVQCPTLVTHRTAIATRGSRRVGTSRSGTRRPFRRASRRRPRAVDRHGSASGRGRGVPDRRAAGSEVRPRPRDRALH
jgi:pimeloyl-ACP methyl ester carboxylesterase